MSLQKVLPYTKEARALSKILRKEMTGSEKVIWEKIRKKQLEVDFFRQFPILDYVVDFYCKEIGLAIEIDGSLHDNQFIEDSKRQSRIEQLGVKFIRFSNDQVLNNFEVVLKELKETIDLLKEE
ncbi:endonuclease domain-containing protein [Aquimarina litoralis]|uniref:endonuclease domain-containing protein n=1 Tax=Aquimarina litoralis TaxID=584605 RepID=UPI001C574831|nr:endonuclease domain-containing protein [Aquimarina litoralis]MBW1294729.1 DUF559 domain-containing protein [Aquimarina litoralis]